MATIRACNINLNNNDLTLIVFAAIYFCIKIFSLVLHVV